MMYRMIYRIDLKKHATILCSMLLHERKVQNKK